MNTICQRCLLIARKIREPWLIVSHLASITEVLSGSERRRAFANLSIKIECIVALFFFFVLQMFCPLTKLSIIPMLIVIPPSHFSKRKQTRIDHILHSVLVRHPFSPATSLCTKHFLPSDH